ncbi:MAG TPA: hypothetical protein VJ023_11420 [Pyrinomonadaceae bacterium]|nr:hypothetical protein [Pyrinomonadaceae bacterium]
MDRQQTENLFRRLKGVVVTLKTISGGVYEGRVSEVTDDYLCLIEREDSEPTKVFVFFAALESMIVNEVATG